MKTLDYKYPDGTVFEEYVLKSEKALVTVDPKGGYVTSWKVKNKPLDQFLNVFYRGSSKKRSGIPILFPYFGKAKHRRQHGFGRDSTWNVKTHSHTHIILELSSHDIPSDAKKEYSYDFIAQLEIKIDESGSLFYSLSVKNTGSKYLPISPGIHPYWDIQNEEKKNIKVDGLTQFDASVVDWDNNPPDIGYLFHEKVILHFPDRKMSIEDISSERKIKEMVVWSQPINKPDFNFVCFEPVCGGNFSIDENPIVIPPGKEWKMELKMSATLR